MKTTVMFVELIVVGVGAMIALMVLGLAVYYPQAIPDLSVYSDYSSLLLTLGLAVSYGLGAIVDKLSYRLFKTREVSIRNRIFAKEQANECKNYKNDECYRQARRRLYESNHHEMIEVHEYSRSKVRICRGWTVDSILLGIAIIGRNIMLGRWESQWFISLLGAIVLGIASAVAWQITEEVDIRWLCDFKHTQR